MDQVFCLRITRTYIKEKNIILLALVSEQSSFLDRMLSFVSDRADANISPTGVTGHTSTGKGARDTRLNLI